VAKNATIEHRCFFQPNYREKGGCWQNSRNLDQGNAMAESPNSIAIYQNEDGGIRIEVQLQQDTVWLSRRQLSVLFDKDVRTVNEHIRIL
jgi:hypothetical protein